MKYSNTTIRELTARYSRVLRKCALLNAALLLSVAFAVPAMAETSFLAEKDQELSGTYTAYVNTNSTRAGVATIDYGTSGVTVAERTVFDDNETQVSAGGAIKALNGLTIGNGVTFSNNTATGNAWGGGALYIKLANKGTASENTAVSIGENVKFNGNEAGLGGAIALEYGNVSVGAESEFSGNKATNGGAIAMWKDAEHGDLKSSLSLTDVSFKANAATGNGGAISIDKDAGTVTVSGGLFEGNSANMGGGIYNNDTLTIQNGTVFTNNSAHAGGAIYTYMDSSVALGDDVAFRNNTAKAQKADGAGDAGGALYIDRATVTAGSGTTFVGNTALGEAYTYPDGSVAKGIGGAVYSYNSKVNFGDKTVFDGNQAQYAGGAVYNWNPDGEGLSVGDESVFKNNASVQGNGGAVANFDGSFTAGNNVSFSGNSAIKGNGGAIANMTFTEGKTASVTVGSGASFVGNNAYLGGAVYNDASLTIGVDATFDGNGSLDTTYAGGAIYNAGTGTVNEIVNATFNGNAAQYGGAINNSGVVASELGQISVTSSTFSNNQAKNGGALRNQGEFTLKGTSGAEVVDSAFSGNIAENGAAVWNGERGQMTIDETTFDSNVATGGLGQGGAITNNGTLSLSNSVFSNNTADKLGGAIFNDKKGSLTLVGENTFSGNTANGVGNDIYNIGTLTNNGKATLSSGLVNAGTFTNNSGASLTLGGVVELQSALANDGTLTFEKGSSLKVALMDSSALTSIITGSGTVSGDTSLIIENGSTGGSIKIENDTTKLQLTDNTLYDIVNENGTITVTKKSAEEAAGTLAAAGASSNEAAAIVAMSGVSTTGNAQADAVLNQVTTAAQSGDVATASALVESIHPTDAPVLQSVSTNTAVLGAVVNRLAVVGGGAPVAAQGRSGGDMVSKLSPWVQGLYNKTHNSQGIGFDAYSQGFAFGVDTDLTDAWTVGLGYAYTATDVKNSAHKTQVYGDNYFIYGQYKPSAWYINGVINYGHSDYKDTGAMTSRYDVDTYGAQIMTGYQWDILDNYAGVRYTYIDVDRYNNGLTEVDTKNSQVATAVIGTKVSKDFTPAKGVVLTPEFRLAGTYDFKADNSKATIGIMGSTASYTIENRRLHRAAVETGVGLTASIRNLELSANYDASLRSESNTQAVNLKAIYHF